MKFLHCVAVWVAGYIGISYSCMVHAAEYNGTFAPTMHSADDLKLYSYFCLEKQQKLCIGISTDGDPSYNADLPYLLQVKRREANEEKGLDYQKMRWTVDRTNGRIQLSNFTSLCAAKQFDTNTYPAAVALRPCGTVGKLEQWNLKSFLRDITEQGTITLGAYPNQCLTLMNCNRQSLGYCDPNSNTAYPSGKAMDAEDLRGAYLKMMPCVAKSTSQSWRQTLDCALGCSPFMTQDKICDEACNTKSCNWDNNACATKRPSMPTPRPTYKPSRSPTTSQPTASPSQAPTYSAPTNAPTFTPSHSPSRAPTTSKPTKNPTYSSPTLSPMSSEPTMQPTTSTPTVSPSLAPTTSAPSLHPTMQPTESPTAKPTTEPTPQAIATQIELEQATNGNDIQWWIWIIVSLVALCCCSGIAYGWYVKRATAVHTAAANAARGDSDVEQGKQHQVRIYELDEIQVVDTKPVSVFAGSTRFTRIDDPVLEEGNERGEDNLLVNSPMKKQRSSGSRRANSSDDSLPPPPIPQMKKSQEDIDLELL